jgi:GTP cyclohydrolase IA
MGYEMLTENQAVSTNGKNSHKQVDFDKVRELGRELLIALGEDPEREGLKDTPRRWASWWQEFIEYQPGTTDTSFEPITTDQMVVISGMRIYSLCEHHLLPFWCDVSIGYVVHEKVLGLSKFARIAQKVAHRLQLQERIVHDIANEVQAVTGSNDVAVLASGVHMCMVMRGIKTEGLVSSLDTRGKFSEQPDMRADFLRLAGYKAGDKSAAR